MFIKSIVKLFVNLITKSLDISFDICYKLVGGGKMITVKQNTTLVGVSELRTKLDLLLKKLKGTRVVIEKRHKPVAVLVSSEEYERNQKLLDMAEDIVLGHIAESRYKGSSGKDYIDIEELLKKSA